MLIRFPFFVTRRISNLEDLSSSYSAYPSLLSNGIRFNNVVFGVLSRMGCGLLLQLDWLRERGYTDESLYFVAYSTPLFCFKVVLMKASSDYSIAKLGSRVI